VIYIDKSRLRVRASKEKSQSSKRVEIRVYFLQELDTTNNYSQGLEEHLTISNARHMTIAQAILICQQLERRNINIWIFTDSQLTLKKLQNVKNQDFAKIQD